MKNRLRRCGTLHGMQRQFGPGGRSRIRSGCAALVFGMAGLAAGAQSNRVVAVRDRLQPLAAGAVTIGGYLGNKMDLCINNRIVLQPAAPFLRIFKTKNLDPGGYWGEFIGKWATAAALACRYQSNPALTGKANTAMQELIHAPAENGYISTYNASDAFKVWDIWIQKYVLLGLIAQYDEAGDLQYLRAAQRSADYLLSKTGPGKMSLEEYGPPFHKGGVNFSILEPIVLLYQRTGDKRYLKYAEYIVASWSKPGKYAPKGVRLIENAEAGLPLVQYEVHHAYALMSNFEGLCELYRATGNKRYLDACIKFAEAVEKYELMITGTVCNHEMWYNGALAQTGVLEQPNETCATVTWMKLCYQLLRLTGNPRWADAMERSLYNGLLGAMMPRGEWWAYHSQLNGQRMPSRVQGCDISCCVSSGPRGLLITPEWMAMKMPNDALAVNLYSAGKITHQLKNGASVQLTEATTYPAGGNIRFTVQTQRPVTFPLQLRIPDWSKKTKLTVNGKPVTAAPGGYVTLHRVWEQGDRIELELDMRGRIVHAPSGTDQAVVRGPVVLAMDSRLVPEQDTAIWLIGGARKFEPFPGNPKYRSLDPAHDFDSQKEDVYIDLRPVDVPDKNIWMAFEVPFTDRPIFHIHREKRILMCDYASAGNQWSETNLYRVWLPQPMYMGNMYARNTWKLLGYGMKAPMKVPAYITEALKDK
ncbi:glycoside hydrolase family 127 protein [Niabella aurantiaca]|uniref:glycoside hydrolase family 127 protein n=1 Tax=Niabella aurantiaca TaxID=379900 RepID=UPI000594645D|nr:beta-L-arabinofuranosidase domain-containing protein [Niabella aurantiaca]